MADSTESSVVIGAVPSAVLAVISDFEAYPSWTGAVRDAEVLDRDANGRARTVRFVLDAGALRDTYTLAYSWQIDADGAGSISWTLVEAGILKAMDGSYRLSPAPQSATEVTYTLSVEIRMPMLGMLRRRAEKTIVDTALNELRRRVEG